MFSWKKLFVNTLALSFLVPALPARAADVDYDKMWEEILADSRIVAKDRVKNIDTFNPVDELLEAIIRDRAKFLSSTVKLGHNSMLGENIRGENGTISERRFITSPDSARRDGGKDKMKFLKHQGESIVACRHGTLDSVSVDPSQFRDYGLGGGSARKGMIYAQVCAGEQYEEKEEQCGRDLRTSYDSWSKRAIDKRFRFKGFSNKVTFIYSLSDPPGFEGCSTKDGLERLFAPIKKAIEARDSGSGTVGVPPRSGLPGSSFREAKVQEWAERVFTACTDFKKLKITTHSPTISPIHKDSQFERLLRNKFGATATIHTPEEEEAVAGGLQIPKEKDVFSDSWKDGVDGSRDALRKVQREYLGDLRGPRGGRLLNEHNYGIGVCRGAGGVRGGGIRGNQGLGLDGRGGFRDANPPPKYYRAKSGA